jgi:hypothetical protein
MLYRHDAGASRISQDALRQIGESSADCKGASEASAATASLTMHFVTWR